MNKKVLIASILGSTFLLGLGGCLINKNVDSKADAQSNSRGEVSLILDEVEAGEVPDYFSILCPIKTDNLSYEDYKDKDLVISYSVNSQFEGKEVMKMNVVDYEEDGTTPKTVYYEAEVVGRVKAWIPYSIYAIEKDNAFFELPEAYSSDMKDYLVTNDIYECGFEDQEQASPYNTVVDLKSCTISPDDVEDKLYTKLTYSINGGEEKTVIAQKEYKVIPGTAIFTDFSYEAQIFACKGDVIEYKVTIPTKDKDAVYEDVQKVVVK